MLQEFFLFLFLFLFLSLSLGRIRTWLTVLDVCITIVILNAKCINLNAKFINLNAKFIISNANRYLPFKRWAVLLSYLWIPRAFLSRRPHL